MLLWDLIVSPPVFFTIVILASLYVIFKSADLLVYGISGYAKKLGISEATSGLLVVALAASMPEIISSIMGLEMKDTGIALGAILGTNMVHLVLLLGIVMIIGKNIKLEGEVITKQRWLIYAILMLPLILMLDGKLSRTDGIILLAAFTLYLWKIWKQEGSLGKLRSVPAKKLWKDAFIFLGSLTAMLLAGRWLAFSTSNIANIFGIPSYILAITIIGIGAAIPDFAINLKAILKGHSDIGIGESIGSAAIELCLYLGLVAIFFPFTFTSKAIWATLFFLMTGLTFITILIKKGKANWKHGILLCLLYLGFIITQIAIM